MIPYLRLRAAACCLQVIALHFSYFLFILFSFSFVFAVPFVQGSRLPDIHLSGIFKVDDREQLKKNYHHNSPTSRARLGFPAILVRGKNEIELLN